jgi:transposase
MTKIINYVGIDMAKASFVSAFKEAGEPRQFNNTAHGLNSFFKDLTRLKLNKTDTIIGVESTGSYHFQLCLACQDRGYLIKVINPLIIKKHNQTTLRRVKSDKQDARLIRYCLAQGYGYEFETTQDQFILKALVRQRNALAALQTKVYLQNQDMQLKQQAIKAGINPIYGQIHQVIKQKIKLIERQLKEFNRPLQKLPQTIPGVGPITAASFISEIVDIKRFKFPKHLTAYIGLDSRVHESGESIKGQGYISKRGNKILRTILYNAASVAVLHDNMFQRFFLKKRSQGKPYRVALVATMRKMTHVIYAVWINQTPYQDNYLSTKQRLTGI